MKNKFIFLALVSIFVYSAVGFAQNDVLESLPDDVRQEIQNQQGKEGQDQGQAQQPSQNIQQEQINPPLIPGPSSTESAVIKSSPGNKISLDIKGMDVVDVLKMLSSRGNFNIVVGKNVTGRVTLFLKDVDIQDAFEIILLSNDLAYEKKGNIINVMTQRDYELQFGGRFQDRKQAKIIQLKYAKAADLSRALLQIKTNIGKVVADENSNTLVLFDSPEAIKQMEEFVKEADLPIQTRVFSLNYALADKLQPKLQEAVTKGVGSIRFDERSNKLAITDYPAKLDELAKVIAAFDEKTPQVLIDAQIIEVKPSDQFQMGVDWNYWIKKYFDIGAAMPINTAASGALIFGATTATPTSQGQYKAVIDLLRTIGETKILSSPRIMALNNQEARIHIGTKDAYITSTVSQNGTGPNVTSQSVNFVDWGIQLHVTPTVNRDGFVTMKIKPEISDATRTDITSEGQVTQVPIISTSEAETTVMVKDGTTIIIGGLTKEKRTKTVRKIPVFGDIPGLGFLFRSTDDKTEKDELVILLTPHIMSGETSYTEFAEIPPTKGAVVKMVDGNIVVDKTSGSLEKGTSQDSVAGYYKLVADKVKGLVILQSRGKEKGDVEALFTVTSSGMLKGEPRIISSTNHNLDNAAIGNIKNASPFSPFPKALDKAEEVFRISLEYR